MYWNVVSRFGFSLPLALILLLPHARLHADTFTGGNPGTGSIAMDGKWQFHPGDDLAWANPSYDDSAWEQLRCDDTWGAQTHPAYAGFAWYRKRIEIEGTDPALSILIPPVQDAYELYWNGKRIGAYGKLPPHARWWPNGHSEVYSLGSASARGVLAMRVWKSPLSSLDVATLGGFTGSPVLGYQPLLVQQAAVLRSQNEQQNLPRFLIAAVIVVAGLLAFVLFLRERSQWLYLVLAVYLIDDGFGSFMQLDSLNYGLHYAPFEMIESICFSLQDISLWCVLLILFGLSSLKTWRRWTLILAGFYLGAELVDNALLYNWQYLGIRGQWIDAITAAIYELTTLYIFFIAGFGLARKRQTALLPLGIAAFLFAVWNFVVQVSSQGVRFTHWTLSARLQGWGLHLGGYHFDTRFLLDTLLFLVLLFTVARQELKEGQRRAQIETELRSAREVQQLLIQKEVPAIPGFSVATVYKPAAEVGGDFFQVLPLSGSGREPGTLIILGDVSGKGLRAAMTVSMIIGTVRTLADYSHDPVEILRGLNTRLIGRLAGRADSGFVTCLMLRVDADGNVLLVNAGHLAPFRDGKELPVAGCLPLGLISDVDLSELSFRLQEGETLTLYTDGVLEARNKRGELYGFERVAGIMSTRPSVEQVAEAACAFGQEDDITILSITRVAAAVESRVSEPAII
jgi:hypothetical protein